MSTWKVVLQAYFYVLFRAVLMPVSTTSWHLRSRCLWRLETLMVSKVWWNYLCLSISVQPDSSSQHVFGPRQLSCLSIQSSAIINFLKLWVYSSFYNKPWLSTCQVTVIIAWQNDFQWIEWAHQTLCFLETAAWRTVSNQQVESARKLHFFFSKYCKTTAQALVPFLESEGFLFPFTGSITFIWRNNEMSLFGNGEMVLHVSPVL